MLWCVVVIEGRVVEGEGGAKQGKNMWECRRCARHEMMLWSETVSLMGL